MLSIPQDKAEAAQFTGYYLRQICAMDSKGGEIIKGGHSVCQSYISGVLDYHGVLQSMKIAPAIDICVPKDVALYDLQKIVLAYLYKNKTHDYFNASPAVTMALYEVFPCR